MAIIGLIQVLHYRGWTFRQYHGGHWDAASDTTPAVTIGYDTFSEVIDEVLARLDKDRRGL